MRLPTFEGLSESIQQWQGVDLEKTLGHVAATTIKVVTPTFEKRDASSTCLPGNNAAVCQKPTDSTGQIQTLAIALGAGIPLGCAVVVLFFLHRRHVKRQRLEDLNDPHKSLDFGTNPQFSSGGKGGKGKKKHPEMAIRDLSGRQGRGLSMDMGSPYLLPGELHGSRASLHSMSRSLRDDTDPYRPVTMLKSDMDSIRAPRRPGDNASMYSAATSLASQQESASLVANARPMSQSFPNRSGSVPPIAEPQRAVINDRKQVPLRKQSASPTEKPLPTISPQFNLDEFVPPPPPPPPKTEETKPPPRSSSVSAKSFTRPPRKSSIAGQIPPLITEPFPAALSPAEFALPQITTSFDNPNDFDLGLYAPSQNDHHISADMLAQPQPQNNRYSIMGLRPLPSDLPEDNPEQRANRIRSFYKEYFDDSKPHPKNAYVDDYDAGYLADYGLYDAASGGVLTQSRPFAQPVTRRAMTPPPRGARGMMDDQHRRHMSTQSAAMRGPRGRAQSAPRKQLPPPTTLSSLPTPHLLKDDSSIFNAIDFAPPVSFRDRQAGRAPDSPLGTARPYSPSVAPHSPLVASYNDLAGVPSPYLLRKSGTFTGLDFAPPPRFRDQSASASDAGSIRSNRSGISNMGQNAIRQGAYRVSRIPTEMVASKDDFANQLKPRWDMRNGSNIMG